MELITDHRFRKTIKVIRALIMITLSCSILMMLLIFVILGYAKYLGPPPLAVSQSTLYYADDGTIIGESNSGQKRYWLPLEKIPANLKNAIISIEDQNFFDHHGFDFRRIGGAIVADIRAMAKVQGASTITQQYARNLFLEHDKTWKRKLHEAFYTIRLEMNYSKNEILEGYLNTIYFGNGAYGAQAASQFYFGKNAWELTLGESSMIAGIPKGAGVYSPLVSMENAKKRQSLILQAMQKNGFITKEKALAAQTETIKLVGEHPHTKIETAPYFQDAVRKVLKTELNIDERVIAQGGLNIYTTLNTKQQEIAEKTVADVISADSDIQVGVVAMETDTGHVKAMVGGRDYMNSPFNRTTQAIRQPGSTIKPILYYAALEQGFTPATTMKSEPTSFRFDDNRAEYAPKNFNHKYANGEITMAQALALSDNIFAVKTQLFLGEDVLATTAKKFGIATPVAKVPSAALGTSGVRVIEMANAYSMLANGGKKIEPVFIKRIEDSEGNILFESAKKQKTVLDRAHTFVMSHMMTGMFDENLNGYTRVTGSPIMKKLTRTYAGKSGTTETDSWMIGFTKDLTTAVWTGYDKGMALESAVEKMYAKNIWAEFMETALKDMPPKNFTAPKGVVAAEIDPEKGLLTTKDCPVKRLTYFKAGTEPTQYCTDHISDGEAPPKEQENKQKIPWFKKIFGH